MPVKLEARYAYYRRCQAVMRNGAQCRCPARKGSEICRNHSEQMEMAERRRAQQRAVMCRAAEKLSKETGRLHTIKELLLSRRGMQLALNEVMQAIVDNRLDERSARELLEQLRTALLLKRRFPGETKSGGRAQPVPWPRLAMMWGEVQY